MSYTIHYQAKAVDEYESAIKRYLVKSEIAAINFQLAVKEKMDLLRTRPGSFKRTYKAFHEISLKKYPFSII